MCKFVYNLKLKKMFNIKFNGINLILKSNSIIDKIEYSKNVEEAKNRIDYFLRQEFKNYNGELELDLALGCHFFVIRNNYRIEKELQHISSRIPKT